MAITEDISSKVESAVGHVEDAMGVQAPTSTPFVLLELPVLSPQNPESCIDTRQQEKLRERRCPKLDCL